ncbi:hypothetical protein GmHk_04G009663 [Glycine max]|nr:hypothetical protein GmHk_04G009663 [Glycine max]
MVDTKCTRCGEKEENVVHALLLCEEVSRIWFASNLGGRIQVSEDDSFAIWLYDCMKIGDWDFWGGFVNCLGSHGLQGSNGLFTSTTVELKC